MPRHVRSGCWRAWTRAQTRVLVIGLFYGMNCYGEVQRSLFAKGQAPTGVSAIAPTRVQFRRLSLVAPSSARYALPLALYTP
jgi:hypothetical protein